MGRAREGGRAPRSADGRGGPPAASALDAAARRLAAAGCIAAHDEARQLLAVAPDATTLERLIGRREVGEPLAWITGTTEFCGRTLHVDPGVYVPRPQSEELARRAAALLATKGHDRGAMRAADLCTGTGAIAFHLMAEVPHAAVCGIDIDAASVACARRNGVPGLVGDLGEPLRSGAFDIVTAVAPYTPSGQLHLLASDVRRHEARRALDGGADGLDVVRRIVRSAGRLLRADGWLVIELGAEQDHEITPSLFEAGFGAPTPWFDSEGDLRGLAAPLTMTVHAV